MELLAHQEVDQLELTVEHLEVLMDLVRVIVNFG